MGENISLAFGRQGQVHALFTYYWDNDPEAQNGRLSYLSCESGCENLDNWSLIPLIDRGWGHAQYTIKVDHQDRARVLFYRGHTSNPSGPAYLLYLWCDNNCADYDSWGGTHLPEFSAGATAGDADLVFDANDNPHIAVYTNANLHYSWCYSDCHSGAATWQTQTVDASRAMAEAMPIGLWPGCIRSVWTAGQRPVLGLDARGNPVIAYDAANLMECYKNPERPQEGKTIQTWESAGLMYFSRP
jgi:hypothetical protein